MAPPKKASTKAKKSPQADGDDAMQVLATQYKAFKKENPAKSARVPESIKDQARKLHDAGQTYSAIAEACGVVLGSVKSWIDGPAAKATTNGKPGRKPGRSIQGASAAKGEWVTIRVDGRELDVRKADFWGLIGGRLEAGR